MTDKTVRDVLIETSGYCIDESCDCYAVYIPKALTAIADVLCDEQGIAKVIKQKHVYHDFNSDTQSFITIPLADTSKSVADMIRGRLA